MISNACLTSTQIGIIVLALATATIHFSRAAADAEISTLFILNGAGYLVLVAALYLPVAALQRFRPQIRWALIGYSSLTVVLYLVWGGMSGEWVFPLGPVDKVIEIALIALLWPASPSRAGQSKLKRTRNATCLAVTKGLQGRFSLTEAGSLL